MVQNLGTRFIIITLVVGFLASAAYFGIGRGDLELGIDLKGGSELIFKFDFEEKDTTTRKTLLTEATGVIQERIDRYGLKDIVIQPIGDDRFAVQVSANDKEKVDPIKELITDLGLLEFRITVEPNATPNYNAYWTMFQEALKKDVDPAEARTIRPEDVKADDKERFPEGLRWYELSDRAKGRYSASRRPTQDGAPVPWVLCQLDTLGLSGEALFNVYSARDQSFGGGQAVYFSVKKTWQGSMAKLTAHEPDKFMAIILNGKVDSAPELRSTLSDSGQITGGFTAEEAKSLAAILQAGALQKRPELISERTIAPDLAGNARDRGVWSTIIGFVLVLFVMFWLYRGPGLLANIALLLNLVLLLGVLTWFGAVLTLPGIAGVVLTVGMAVDANILVFERIKEEKSKGRTVAQAIATGYDRALVTIIDANLTTLITAYFLFQIGSGPVRGFGITLAIGIIASMFTALYVTRTLFAVLLKKGIVTEARMRGVFAPPKIPWMSFQRTAIVISTIAMVAGILLWEIVPEKAKYDLDFTKGSKLIVRFHEEASVDDVRAKIEELGGRKPLYDDVTVRVSAEGIGEAVSSDRGEGFELRSQNIARQEDIDDFKQELRQVFTGRLLPGPFQATIEASPTGGSTGEIYFLNPAVTAPLLQEAFRQYTENRSTAGRLANATVTAAKEPAPGAGAQFRVTFSDTADNPGQVALNVRAALAAFSLEAAREQLSGIATSDDSTATQQAEARAALEELKGFESDQFDAAFFKECDPFPLADRIDPSTAQEHRDAAVKAIALSILGIILYVAFRFRSWSFGFAAVVALVHDVVVVLGVVGLVDWLGIVDARLNLVTVAAFLTLIGYSINDSIVVFDRIRENRGSGRTRLREIIDRSINQTFSRTIRTTTTTWIVVIVLLAMNLGTNSSLEGFAFILTMGVLVGTYSSIFIASPTLLYLPWLWKRSGSSVKAFAKKVVPWWIGVTVVLVAIDTLEGRIDFGTDFSLALFNDILLSIPAGILAYFLANFVRYVRTEEDADAAVPA